MPSDVLHRPTHPVYGSLSRRPVTSRAVGLRIPLVISLRLTKPQACHLIERRFVTWLGTGLLLNRTRVCYLTKRSLATLHVPVTPPRHIHLPLTQVVHDDFHLMGKGKVANATTLQMWRMLQCCKCCSLFFPHTRVRARGDKIFFLPVEVVQLW